MKQECCVEDVHDLHEEMAEACEENEDEVEREICHTQVRESLEQAKEMCYPAPSCWEESRAALDEYLSYCETVEGGWARELCWVKAHLEHE
jgi:hypothetical protein